MRNDVTKVTVGFGVIALVAFGGLTTIGCSGADGASGLVGAPGAGGGEGASGPVGPTGPAATTPPPPPAPAGAPKAVYTLSNDATSNAIFVYDRAVDGALTPKDAFATGGQGTASGLGDQGALVFDKKQNAFFAVNAGDSSISMLALRDDGSLSLVSKIGSGGVKPISVTVSGNVVYVLNEGDATDGACISGFRISAGGLSRIVGSTHGLSAAHPGPAQIQFSPDGSTLVVTEKGTNMIDTYVVTDGVATDPIAQPSAGQTPFGFAFSAGSQLLVSEAFGGADGAGAASSYTLGAGGALVARSSSVVSTQSAPCWVTVAGTHAYVTNTKSNTVTGYTIAADGALTLLDAGGVSAQTGAGPIDAAVTEENAVLYTLDAKDHQISVFAIATNGTLTKKPALAGMPEFAVGLVAR